MAYYDLILNSPMFKKIMEYLLTTYSYSEIYYNYYLKDYYLYFQKMYFQYFFDKYYLLIKEGQIVFETYSLLNISNDILKLYDIVIYAFYDEKTNKINKIILNLQDENIIINEPNSTSIEPSVENPYETIELTDNNNKEVYDIDLSFPYNYCFKTNKFNLHFWRYYILLKYNKQISDDIEITALDKNFNIHTLKNGYLTF